MEQNKEIKGILSAEGKTFGIVVSKFNSLITEQLSKGAINCIIDHGGSHPIIVYVPGSLELTIATKTLIHAGSYDAIICIGAIIKGDTDHYDYVAANTASNITVLSRETNIPILFAVLTTHTMEQAFNRAGIKGNAGYSAALAAIEIASVCEQIKNTPSKE